MDRSKRSGWCWADLLFPPECIVLHETTGFNGQVFSYWDMDGHLQYAVTNELANNLFSRIEPEERT